MAEDAARVFRLDNEVLAFRFTATLGNRTGTVPLERLDAPGRLRLWLRAVGLDLARDATADELASAIELREAIYRLGSATARGLAHTAPDVAVLNAAAANGNPVAQLAARRSRWMLDPRRPVADALSVIARDAITVLGAGPAERVRTCEGANCAGLFLDTSRGGNRRWCSMNTCGNRAKKSRMAGH